MRRQSNPWPAYVDLFAALMVATLGGMVLLAAAYKDMEKANATISQVRKEAEKISKRLQYAVRATSGLQSVVRKCDDDPDDVCIDLYMHFDRNKDELADASERNALHDLAVGLKSAIEHGFQSDERDIVQIVVEGHADDTVDERLGPADRFRYNWNMSSRRASAVLYEFHEAGIDPSEFNIVALGYGESHPLCRDKTDDCRARNRRTTLRLHVDSKLVAAKLSAAR
ncbi:MAG TPA: OmpA family protein [Thermoanaerobaculia bacterium]|nr:OmpA family protein [Thermoanaerobaculia bacterium]